MICYIFSDDEPRRPGQRLPTSMLGNEVITNDIIMMIRMIMTMIMMMIMMMIIIRIIIIRTLLKDDQQVMSKEQLYDLFQQILNVKKFEHQLLYNAMQVVIIHILLK